MSINIRGTQHTAPGLERESEMNFNLNVETFRLVTEGYILVSDDLVIQQFNNLFIERSWLDCWGYWATFPWFLYFQRKRKTFTAWCSSSLCMILFTSWWVSSYLEFPTFSRGRLGGREVWPILQLSISAWSPQVSTSSVFQSCCPSLRLGWRVSWYDFMTAWHGQVVP